MNSILTYFYHQQNFQILKKILDYNNVTVGSPSRTGTTRVSSDHKIMTKSLLFYWSLNIFYDKPKDTKEGEEFVKSFKKITD